MASIGRVIQAIELFDSGDDDIQLVPLTIGETIRYDFVDENDIRNIFIDPQGTCVLRHEDGAQMMMLTKSVHRDDEHLCWLLIGHLYDDQWHASSVFQLTGEADSMDELAAEPALAFATFLVGYGITGSYDDIWGFVHFGYDGGGNRH